MTIESCGAVCVAVCVAVDEYQVTYTGMDVVKGIRQNRNLCAMCSVTHFLGVPMNVRCACVRACVYVFAFVCVCCVYTGMDVVKAIESVRCDQNDNPLAPVKMISVRVK